MKASKLGQPQSVILGTLILLYLFTRLFNLLALPLFTDESIYIYWAKVIATTHSQFFISLTDGKPPILIWAISILLSIFPNSWYLIAGRLPSVFAGFLSLIGIYFLSNELFASRKAAVVAAVLYILSPFALLYDRMALFDSLLSALLLWSVYFSVRTAKSMKVFDSVLWGVTLGLAFLAKPTALLFLPLTFFAYVFFFPVKIWKKQWQKGLGFPVLAFLIGEGMNNLQRISSAYPAMIRKNAQFQQPIPELLKNPFELTWGNLHSFFPWFISYMTWPLFVLGIIAFIFLMIKKRRDGLVLFGLWLLPLIALATVGREVFPRYLLFVTPYFLLPISYLVSRLDILKGKLHFVLAVVFLLVLIPVVLFDYYLLVDPVKAPMPDADYNQYVAEHPSGYGLDKVYTFLRSEEKTQKITLVTQGTFGLYPYAFYLEFWGDPNIRILPKWPLESLDSQIYAAQKTSTVYVLIKEHESIPPSLPLELVLKSEKPSHRYPLLLTKIKAP